MAPLALDGSNLGERHQYYNKLLKEAIANSQPVPEFKLEDNDIENLLKIDLACYNRDVDYIVNVLKCGDMLCVSRALKKSTWLVTEQQYAHIINADYLHTQLRPYMSTKAFIKLNKHLRHTIQDEARAEQFYLHEEKSTDALKWLPHCSVAFIEKNVQKHIHDLKIRTFKRLCEKSITIFEVIYLNINSYERSRFAQAAIFLLNVDVDKYLDIIEKANEYHSYPKFNDKTTAIIMKHSPKRIIDNFANYVSYIDIPTFSKYIKADEIKTFLYTWANNSDNDFDQSRSLKNFFKYDSLKHFIKRLPISEQFNFVKTVFIDKENADAIEENLQPDAEPYYMSKLYKVVDTPSYDWYVFATFEHAFEVITSKISQDLDSKEKIPLLRVLISCAGHNMQHIQTLLEYYLNKHKNDQVILTSKFCTMLLNYNTNLYQCDEKTWNLLNELFKIITVYEENCKSNLKKLSLFVNTVIVYDLIHDQSVPKNIEQQFSFRTLKSFKANLNAEQKEKVFRFLYNTLTNKFKDSISDEESLNTTINILTHMLQLLSDWDKEILDYPLVIEKIKECVQAKKQNSWKESLLPLYDFNKSWRKHLFEESVYINPCEEVCLNALKHDPQLLDRNNDEVAGLRTNDAVSLRRFITKLRIYWQHSLLRNWTDVYFQNLNKTDGHKATVRGLCTVLPNKQLLQFIDNYKPAQPKIDWNKVDDRVLSIQRYLAKNMHMARPQPGPDSILLFAKGDYLQFALPSLLAIFYNLSKTQSQENIPKLLDAPVSLQKHGIRLAFRKFDHETLKKIFYDCWKASKNVSIRAIIFNFTFELLYNEADPEKAISLWELIEMFIDNLTFEEDKKIYELLSGVEKIPLNVRANYLIKSYKFMKNLILKVKESDRGHYKALSEQIAQHSREIMERMCPNFVTAIIQEFIDEIFFGSGNSSDIYSPGGLSVITAYLLCSKNEDDQMQKYETVFVPIMKRALAMWGEKRDGNFVIRSNFGQLLNRLTIDLNEYVVPNKMIIPLKMFTNIQNELEKNLPVPENYIMLTRWKFTTAIVRLANNSNESIENWESTFTELAPEFGKICLEYLKEDVKLYFPCIYKLFSKALNGMPDTLIANEGKLKMYQGMLADEDFVQGYLTIIEVNADSNYYNKSKYEDLWKQILSHPSVEVKMHYYNKNRHTRRYFS